MSVFDDVPEGAREVVEALLLEPTVPEAALLVELSAHLETIHAAAGQNEFLDVSLALRLTEVSRALIGESRRRDDGARRLVQAAVRYFIIDDDADPDLESVCGLDDDAEVCNAVARALGRNDLIIEI